MLHAGGGSLHFLSQDFGTAFTNNEFSTPRVGGTSLLQCAVVLPTSPVTNIMKSDFDEHAEQENKNPPSRI